MAGSARLPETLTEGNSLLVGVRIPLSNHRLASEATHVSYAVANALSERPPQSPEDVVLKKFTAVIERDSDTGLYVGWIPGFPGAHSQGETIDELRTNLEEVLEMLLEDGEPRLESEFVGIQTVEAG